jgi:KaiC/GvpD/RAD55 family RecA-like ATPase
MPQHPARILIVGASGSGKTNSLLNFLFRSVFHRIYLFARTLDEELYQFLIVQMQHMEKLCGEKLITFDNTLDNLPELEDFDKRKQNLLIFDDMVLEANQKAKIGKFFIMGRKFNITTVFISQSFFDIEKIFRENVTHLVLHKLSDMRSLEIFPRIFCSDVTVDELKRKYTEAVNTLDGHGHLLIDVNQKDKSLKLRVNFSSIFI